MTKKFETDDNFFRRRRGSFSDSDLGVLRLFDESVLLFLFTETAALAAGGCCEKLFSFDDFML